MRYFWASTFHRSTIPEDISSNKSCPVPVFRARHSDLGVHRTQISSVLGIPAGDTQNSEILKLGQVKSSTSLLKTQ